MKGHIFLYSTCCVIESCTISYKNDKQSSGSNVTFFCILCKIHTLYVIKYQQNNPKTGG